MGCSKDLRAISTRTETAACKCTMRRVKYAGSMQPGIDASTHSRRIGIFKRGVLPIQDIRILADKPARPTSF